MNEAMLTIHEMVRLAGNNYYKVLKAVTDLGLKGWVRGNGDRVWTKAEAVKIIKRANEH